MTAKEAFSEILAMPGNPPALQLTLQGGHELRIDLHSSGYITVWWKGEPIEFEPM